MRMSMHRTLAAITLVLAAGALVTAREQMPVLPIADGPILIEELITTQNFRHRVDEYVALHRMLEGPLPRLRVSTNMDEIRVAQQALATRLKQARWSAVPGEIITADVGRMFRRRIAECLSPADWEAILNEVTVEEQGPPVRAVTLRVNMEWPEDVPFTFVPPQLLAALPSLPAELQYRIVGRSLVLWDHHANLIVDFLPGALGSTT